MFGISVTGVMYVHTDKFIYYYMFIILYTYTYDLSSVTIIII